MSNVNNFSSILQLSKQLEGLSIFPSYISALSSAIDPVPFDELRSTMQQLNNLLDVLGGPQTFSALTEQMSAISKSLPKFDISSLASGIKVQDDSVELTPQAKETLDTLEEKVQTSETADQNTTETDVYPTTSTDTNSVSHTSYLDAKITPSGTYELPKSDFLKRYLPLLKFIIEVILIPMVLNYFSQTDISPLVDISQERLQVEEQRLEAEQERNKLLNAQLEAALKNNELLEERLNADQKRNELLEAIYQTLTDQTPLSNE